MCGVYFPGIGVLRSQYLPEETRATIMNLFRIGLNLIVVVVLQQIEMMDNQTVFMLCAMLGTAALCQQYLYQATSGTKQQQAEVVADLQGQELPATDAELNDVEAADVESGKSTGADGAVAQATGKDM